jgi:RNA 2',3'-cyclic 3'-phosphodiesterase
MAGRRVRLFLALDLPGDTRSELAAWRDRTMAGAEEIRPVPPEALHVTLVFLGWQDADGVEAIGRATGDAVAGLRAPELEPLEVCAVPPRRARLFALGLGDVEGLCASVQAAAAAALQRAGFHEPEGRRFWPHVTLARVRRGARAPGPPLEGPALAPFVATELVLYRSQPGPDGAVYHALARWTLDRRPAP